MVYFESKDTWSEEAQDMPTAAAFRCTKNFSSLKSRREQVREWSAILPLSLNRRFARHTTPI
jgi:hypothetical protein